MSDASIEHRAKFDNIRYAQLWEDADVLHKAFRHRSGGRYLSICSAGDNALALLLLDPKEVVAADLSAAQLDCLRFRMAAYQELEHEEFLELAGTCDSARRAELFERVLRNLYGAALEFWRGQREQVLLHGFANIGKFENYFRTFRRYVLPLIHSRQTLLDVFIPRTSAERQAFFAGRWNTWRWRLATSFFFSKFTMGRMGRDPAFFDHVEGSAAAHVRRKVEFAAVAQDPSQNPYMRAILLGQQGRVLPLAWRADSYDIIRRRLNRLTLLQGPVQSADGPFDGFNLSDIFEYMPVALMQEVYSALLQKAAPQARFVYWNMMAPRRATGPLLDRVRRQSDIERDLKQIDKAFFYSDLVVEDVVR